MIAINELAKTIQDGLNANSGIKFRVFADAAKYERALKTPLGKRKYTNCMLRMGSSSVVPTQGVAVASQTAMLEVCVQFTPETMESVIAAHRAALDGYFGNTAVQTMLDGDKTFTVATTYALATTGTVEQRPLAGLSLTYFVNISYGYVENGLNSSRVKFTLDGGEIPYTIASVRKTPTMDSNTYSNDSGQARSRNTAFIHTFEFETPALSGASVSNGVIANILGNDLNTPHTLVMTVGDESPHTYTVIFGETALNVQGINNGGLTFSLVESFEVT